MTSGPAYFSDACVRKSGNGRRRTHVFGQEDRPPADLRAQVLDHHLASIAHPRSCQDGVVLQCFGITLEREPLSFDVKLCRSDAYGCESDERRVREDWIVPEGTLLPTQPLHPRFLQHPEVFQR
jgi:hypothetical protein